MFSKMCISRPNRIVSCHFTMRRSAHAHHIHLNLFYKTVLWFCPVHSHQYAHSLTLTHTHSFTRPSIHEAHTHTVQTHDTHKQERMYFSFSSIISLQHDHMEKWWVHLRPNKKKYLQSVVVVVPNGSYTARAAAKVIFTDRVFLWMMCVSVS